MIKGPTHWNDPSRYYVQTNNPTEEMLRKHSEIAVKSLRELFSEILIEKTIAGWMESCGSVALTNCVAALGRDFTLNCPGGYQPQTDELVTSYLNDPRNYKKLKAVRDNLDPSSVPGNRIPQYFPIAAQDVFGISATYREGMSFDQVAGETANGNPIQICLKTPSHYLAVVAFDEDTKELIYKDPWPARLPDGKGGCNRRMNKTEFDANVEPFMVVYKIP